MTDDPYDPSRFSPPEYRPMPPAPDVTPAPVPEPRRRRVSVLLAGAAVAAALVVGAGIGVAIAVATEDSGSSTPAGAPPSTTVGSPVGTGDQPADTGKKGTNGAAPTRGTIAAIDGSTWTVKTLKGRTIKVTITSTTKFGTKKAPVAKTAFVVGKKIAIVGQPSGSGTITATRIRAVGAGSAGKAPASSASSATPSPTRS